MKTMESKILPVPKIKAIIEGYHAAGPFDHVTCYVISLLEQFILEWRISVPWRFSGVSSTPRRIIVGGFWLRPLGTHPLSPPIRAGASRLQPSGIPIEHRLSLHGF